MYTDIDSVTNLLTEERVWNIVKPSIDKYSAERRKEMRPDSPTASILRKRSRVESEFEMDLKQ